MFKGRRQLFQKQHRPFRAQEGIYAGRFLNFRDRFFDARDGWL